MARSLSDLPPKQQWMVSAVLCVALLGIYYMQFWRAGAQRIDQMRNEIGATRAELLEIQAVAASLPELEAELGQLDSRIEILSHILPEEYETADLLRGVGTLAAQSNLKIRDLEFKDPEPYEFYAESPIELELTGTFHDLARFFDRIGKFARIINVDEVEIVATGDPEIGTVRAVVTAMTFIFIDDDPEEGDGMSPGDARELLGQ